VNRFLYFLLFASAVASSAEASPAPYLVHGWRRGKMVLPPEEEMEKYFAEIEALRKRDVELAAKDYHRFILEYGGRTCAWRGRYVPVRTRIYDLFKHDKALAAAYVRRYGAAAGKDYRRALRSGDVASMAKTAFSYCPAPAAVKALLFLVSYHLDHGEFDDAVLYLDMLRKAGVKKREVDSFFRAVRTLSAWGEGAEEGSGRLRISGERPLWIGGVEISTVYPEDVKAYRRTDTVYSAVAAEGRVVVFNGRNLYAYDEETGRHVWRPGRGHEARVVSIFKGDLVAAGKKSRKGGMLLPRRIGELIVKKGVVHAVFTRSGGRLVGAYRLSSGLPIEEIDASRMKRLLDERITGDVLAAEMGMDVSGETIFIALCGDVERKARGYLLAYSWRRKCLLWKAELFEAWKNYGYSFRPAWSMIVKKAGPYVAVFSTTGFLGVYRARDGGLVWKRYFTPPEGRVFVPRQDFPREGDFFLPVVTLGCIVVEGPERGELSVFSLSDGERTAAVKLGGDPRWGVAARRGLACAVRKEGGGGTDLVYVNVSRGRKEWTIRGVSGFPGFVRGRFLYCCGQAGEILEVDVARGECTGRIRPAGCPFPGRVLMGKNLYVVNCSGIFAYACR